MSENTLPVVPKAPEEKYDCCIICGVETPYSEDTTIELRRFYVEGAGQLCKSCYSSNTEE